MGGGKEPAASGVGVAVSHGRTLAGARRRRHAAMLNVSRMPLEDRLLVRAGDLDHDQGGERLVGRVGGDHVVLGGAVGSDTVGVDQVGADEDTVVVRLGDLGVTARH